MFEAIVRKPKRGNFIAMCQLEINFTTYEFDTIVSYLHCFLSLVKVNLVTKI